MGSASLRQRRGLSFAVARSLLLAAPAQLGVAWPRPLVAPAPLGVAWPPPLVKPTQLAAALLQSASRPALALSPLSLHSSVAPQTSHHHHSHMTCAFVLWVPTRKSASWDHRTSQSILAYTIQVCIWAARVATSAQALALCLALVMLVAWSQHLPESLRSRIDYRRRLSLAFHRRYQSLTFRYCRSLAFRRAFQR